VVQNLGDDRRIGEKRQNHQGNGPVAGVDSRSLSGLRQCMADLGLKRGVVIYGGEEPRRVGSGIELLPRSRVARGEEPLPI